MQKDVVLGMDIGGTFTKFGIIDKKGKIYVENTISTHEYETVNDFALALRKHLYNTLGSDKSGFNLRGIGIGAPNGNYYTGKIEFAPNLKWKGVVDLTRVIEEEFDLPAVLTNDANAAALGEMLFGNAKNMKDFIMITLGTGLGSGLVVNGQLVYGHDGFAGELGHTRAVDNGRQCGCGKRGCLETYVSATGIKRTIFELLADENVDSVFRKISFDKLKPSLITAMAEKGDPIAIKAFEKTGFLLGRSLADTVAHVSPQAIFLFGGLAKSGKWILDPTKKAMEEHLLPIYRNKIDILPSALLKKNIAVLGAAALMWKELGD
ncbi:MAG: ROK family protein [Bacteroidales bacterium]|nr:ROK family protein [Bacteroidales bacterium]MBN2699056.1 ROK family protein [Bacteroidales bacterium]